MQRILFLSLSIFAFGFLSTGCSTSNDRRTAGYSRSGREYKEPRAMNHRRLDTNSLYDACLKERPELSCRNRLGR